MDAQAVGLFPFALECCISAHNLELLDGHAEGKYSLSLCCSFLWSLNLSLGHMLLAFHIPTLTLP